jgi:integral membrane protein
MFKTVLGRLRIIGFFEGLSYLLLLGIAMPLKYMFGLPQAVQVIGMAHGILFIVFISLSIQAKVVYRWSFSKMIWLWIASVLPFGPFVADYKLLRHSAAEAKVQV